MTEYYEPSLAETKREYERYKQRRGEVCPNCYNTDANTIRSEGYEHTCLECDHEWGVDPYLGEKYGF